MHGTLNFVRQLEMASDGGLENLGLVLNKVVPTLSANFLYRLYNREFRDVFKGKPLLAIYPLEGYLTKE